MSEVKNVTAGKPKVGGAISAAKAGTTLPTDATSTLDAAFKGLGYVSDSGLVNTNTASTSPVKAWGGDTVMNSQTDKPDQFKFTLLEVLSVDVLKFVYNDENVSGSLETGITVKANSKEAEIRVLVVDMIMREGVLKRMVLPLAQVVTMGDITYVDGSPAGYEVTVQAFPDEDGNTHYEYIVEA